MSAALDAIPAVTPDVPTGPWGVLADLADGDATPRGIRRHEGGLIVAELLGTTQVVAQCLLMHPDTEARRLGVYLVHKLERAQRGAAR